ncbi:MAG TPA: neutral zinc metallopeptidase [Verrucomicrobiae bacterium]|nr:neutral zinc metallopeptidase [Verrucomicrobiae bacterium]
MRWRGARRSSNVDNVGGAGRGIGGIGGRLGLGGVAVVVVVGMLMGQNPMQILAMLAGAPGPEATTAPSAGNTESQDFVAAILGETEDVWDGIFRSSNSRYPHPRLTLFAGTVNSACGGASSASGPFYCPADQKIYLDSEFFRQMEQKLGGGGDFAQAYVIAHEVGHHVQTITGISAKVSEARQAGEKVDGPRGLLVRQELQADCFAGLWAYHAQQRHQWLEAGDIEEALNTASAIGDDRLQKQTQGQVVPDAFTHGTSEQRVRWFKTGFDSGQVSRCDTFAVERP